MTYAVILDKYKKSRDLLVKRRAEREANRSLLSQEEDSLAGLTKDANTLTDSISVVQSFSSGIRADIIKKFEELLTSGVREIFNDDYKISIEFSSSGNSYYADFYVILPDGKKVNISSGEGGGLKDFVSVLQRILYIILEPSRPSKIIFLDENLKAVDGDRAIMAFGFISNLCKELGIQMIAVTHSSAPRALAGKEGVSIIEVSKDTESHVNIIKAVGG